MEFYIQLLISATVTFLFGVGLKYINPRSQLVWYVTHFFEFPIPNPQTDPPSLAPLYTHAITIQNTGTQLASNVEIAHATPPAFFKLSPALEAIPLTIGSGEHLVRIPTLAQNEIVTVEFLSWNVYPNLLYVRSSLGQAKKVSMQPQQIRPVWFNALGMALVLTGIFTVTYLLVRAIFFIGAHF